jgi:transcriptional antiterminator RfaH
VAFGAIQSYVTGRRQRGDNVRQTYLPPCNARVRKTQCYKGKRLLKEDITTARWYAVYCKTHQESIAAVHLHNQNFTVFLPRREAMRRHARKIEKVLRPFFPGYLFVRLDVTREPWRCVNGTVGVVRVVMQHDHPAPAPHGVIESLIAACDSKGVVRSTTFLKIGQKVRVIAGPLTDLVGELDQLSGAERVRVLLNIMGGRTPVMVSRECLMPEGEQ